jgi:hypothetical protein
MVYSYQCAAGTSDVLTGTPPSLVTRQDSINDTSWPRAGPEIEGTWSAGSPRSPPVASYGHGCHSETQNMRVSSTRSSWSSTERVSECTAPKHPECLSAHRVRVRASGITRRLWDRVCDVFPDGSASSCWNCMPRTSSFASGDVDIKASHVRGDSRATTRPNQSVQLLVTPPAFRDPKLQPD